MRTTTKSPNAQRREPKAPRYWIAAVVGLAVLLSGCFGGQSADAFVQTAAPTPEPLYEPLGEVGNNPFFSVDEQVAATNSGVIKLAVAEAAAAGTDPLSAIAQISLTSPSEEEIKSGLYGGSLENTCDPERLITHLLDNPTQGQVWADVQGIDFSEIPNFIRSLEPAVLEADRTVLNHGYDPKGHAIPIISTLQAGTAVLIDDNGDVRTKCYCGNPILPYDQQDYEPPQCLTFFAVVYTSPADRKEVENVPRSVKATNQISSHEGVEWKQVAWGDSSGWVRADESETRYCKPHDKIECVAQAQITQRPGSDDYIGEIQNSYVSVVAPNLDGWSLIKFAETSGWIESSTTGGTSCDYEVACVSSTSGTWTRPGFAGREIVDAGRAQRVEYTGQTFFDGTGTYRQVYVTYPGPSRVGYIKQSDVTPLDTTDCEVGVYCTLFDVDVNVYQESEGTATWGVMWFGEVDLVSSQPTNGRYQIDWGTGTGWVDIGDLHGYVTGHPCVTVSCIQTYGQSAYEPLPDNAGTRSTPTGPIVATFTGKVHDVNGSTYREFTSPSVAGGPAWIEASVGYYPRGWEACEVEPWCVEEFDVCEVKCIAEYNNEGWTVRAIWSPATRLLDIDFVWPSPLTGQPLTGLQSSGIGDFASGPLALSQPVFVNWTDPVTGFSGQAECEVNLCDYLDFDGDLGYLNDTERPNPESCVQVSCSVDRMVGSDGLVRESVAVNWSPATTQLDYLNFDFPAGYTDGTRLDRFPPQTFTQFTGPPGTVVVTWIGPNGQSGTVTCPVGGGCDVFDIAFTTARSAECCPDGSQYVESSSECCPTERQTRGACCAEGSLASAGDACITCDGVKVPNFGCCPSEQVLNSETCCPDGSTVVRTERGAECLPECDGPARAATGECCPGEVSGGICIPDCPDGSTVVASSDGPICEEDSVDPVPTVTPGPTVTPAPTAVPVVTPTPAPTPTPGPTATPVPPTCPNGANQNGDCFRICLPGELNLDGLCICNDGFRLNGINGCIIECPGNQVPINSSECGCPEGTVPTGSGTCQTVQPTCTEGTPTDDGRCRVVVAPVSSFACPDGAVDQGDSCQISTAPSNNGEDVSCPDGWRLVESGGGLQCVRQVEKTTTVACPSGFSFEGDECVRYDVPA